MTNDSEQILHLRRVFSWAESVNIADGTGDGYSYALGGLKAAVDAYVIHSQKLGLLGTTSDVQTLEGTQALRLCENAMLVAAHLSRYDDIVAAVPGFVEGLFQAAVKAFTRLSEAVYMNATFEQMVANLPAREDVYLNWPRGEA